MPMAIARRERGLRLAIGNELDTTHQSGLTNVADMAMRRERCKGLAQHSRLLEDRVDDDAVREQPQCCKGRGASQGITRVGVSVKKMAVLVKATKKCVVYTIGGQCRRDREIAASQSFRDTHQVRRHSLALAREHRSGAAESCRDLIENQQTAMRAARLCDSR